MVRAVLWYNAGARCERTAAGSGRQVVAEALRTGSAGIRRIGLRFLGTLANYPFAHVGRALHQFNALVFASDQELNHPEVHERDLAQVQDFACAAVIHFRSDVCYMIRANPAAQPQLSHASTTVFFNPQHLTLSPAACPFVAPRSLWKLQLSLHRLQFAPTGVAKGPQWIVTTHGLSFNLFSRKIGFWICADNSPYDLLRLLENGPGRTEANAARQRIDR